MKDFCARNDILAFIGEFGVTEKKEAAARARGLTAVAKAAVSRRMVPVLWDTGHDVARMPPRTPTDELTQMLAAAKTAAAALPAPAPTVQAP